MAKTLLFAAFVAALVPVVIAQGRAPQNESIRQEDLRADLFFLAGDSMRGRLTDTEENRATADFIRSRFERMGLTPAGPKRRLLPALTTTTARTSCGAAISGRSCSAAWRRWGS